MNNPDQNGMRAGGLTWRAFNTGAGGPPQRMARARSGLAPRRSPAATDR